MKVPPRTQIVEFGDPGDMFYIMLDGLIDVIKPLDKKEMVKKNEAVLASDKRNKYKYRRGSKIDRMKHRKDLWAQIL